VKVAKSNYHLFHHKIPGNYSMRIVLTVFLTAAFAFASFALAAFLLFRTFRVTAFLAATLFVAFAFAIFFTTGFLSKAFLLGGAFVTAVTAAIVTVVSFFVGVRMSFLVLADAAVSAAARRTGTLSFAIATAAAAATTGLRFVLFGRYRFTESRGFRVLKTAVSYFVSDGRFGH